MRTSIGLLGVRYMMPALGGAIDAKSPSPAMQCVMIEVPPDKLEVARFVTTGRTMRVTTVIDCAKGAEPGRLLLPWDQVRKVVEKTNPKHSNTLRFYSVVNPKGMFDDPDPADPAPDNRPGPRRDQPELDDPGRADAARIETFTESGRSSGRWDFPWLSATRFPHAPGGSVPGWFQMESQDFAEAVRAVEFAVDVKTDRYQLGGIDVRADDDDGGTAVKLVASDGARIATYHLGCDLDGGPRLPRGDANRVAPINAWRMARHVAAGLNAGSIVRFGYRYDDDGVASHWEFKSTYITIQASILEGRFPGWSGAIPKGPTRCRLSFQGIADVVRAFDFAAIATDDERKSVEAEYDGAGLLDVWADAPDVGFGRHKVPVDPDPEHNDAVRFTTMRNHLAEVLRAVAKPDRPLRLDLHGATEPVVVESGPALVLVAQVMSGRPPLHAHDYGDGVGALTVEPPPPEPEPAPAPADVPVADDDTDAGALAELDAGME